MTSLQAQAPSSTDPLPTVAKILEGQATEWHGNQNKTHGDRAIDSGQRSSRMEGSSRIFF